MFSRNLVAARALGPVLLLLATTRLAAQDEPEVLWTFDTGG